MHSLTAKPLLKKHGMINLSKFAAVTSEVNVFRNNNIHVCMKSNTGVEDSEYNRASFLLHPIKNSIIMIKTELIYLKITTLSRMFMKTFTLIIINYSQTAG